MLNCLKKNIIQKNYMQYILKERIISMNEKEKDTIMLKSIIKMNGTMERKYIYKNRLHIL